MIEPVLRGNASCRSRVVGTATLLTAAANICVDKKICYNLTLSKLWKIKLWWWSSVQSKNTEKKMWLWMQHIFWMFSAVMLIFFFPLSFLFFYTLEWEKLGNIVHSRKKCENQELIGTVCLNSQAQFTDHHCYTVALFKGLGSKKGLWVVVVWDSWMNTSLLERRGVPSLTAPFLHK